MAWGGARSGYIGQVAGLGTANAAAESFLGRQPGP